MGKKKNFKSLNITGHRLYELDGKGNITASYDISNNYSVYFYDKKNRLVGSENKLHSPPEVYCKSEYHYSDFDSVNQIIRISYKNNEPISKEVITDKMDLDAKKVVSSYFKNEIDNEYFFNDRKFELIAFKDKMIFCCGRIMEGKNKLTYYLDHDDLIDSLIVEGMESKKKLKFEYIYELK